MGSFVLNFTASAAPVKTGLARQARELLKVGLWGASPSVQARPDVGDRVVVYAGAPEKLFVGHAIVGEGLHQWSPAEQERFPSRLGFALGLSLVRARVWSLSVSLNDVWAATSRGKSGMQATFRSGICHLPDADVELIIARGTRHARARSS